MKILIVGAGAIGGYFGARLLAAGRDTTFLVRARRAEQLRRLGLQLTSPLGDLNLPTPPLVAAGQFDSTYDLVVLSCKAYDLQACVEDFAPAMGPQSKVLPLLNGMRHLEVLDCALGARSSARRAGQDFWHAGFGRPYYPYGPLPKLPLRCP